MQILGLSTEVFPFADEPSTDRRCFTTADFNGASTQVSDVTVSSVTGVITAPAALIPTQVTSGNVYGGGLEGHYSFRLDDVGGYDIENLYNRYRQYRIRRIRMYFIRRKATLTAADLEHVPNNADNCEIAWAVTNYSGMYVAPQAAPSVHLGYAHPYYAMTQQPAHKKLVRRVLGHWQERKKVFKFSWRPTVDRLVNIPQFLNDTPRAGNPGMLDAWLDPASLAGNPTAVPQQAGGLQHRRVRSPWLRTWVARQDALGAGPVYELNGGVLHHGLDIHYKPHSFSPQSVPYFDVRVFLDVEWKGARMVSMGGQDQSPGAIYGFNFNAFT